MKKSTHLSGRRLVLAASAVLFGVMLVLSYRYVANGGMSARQKPSALEAFVGQHLVQLGISNQAKDRKNPQDTGPGSADVATGRAISIEQCQGCHGPDGTGRTAAGGGLYPPPLDLSRTALEGRKRTDGELFYLIRNGIRNTGMPGWQLPDPQVWALVSYIRNLPPTASPGEHTGRVENVTAKSTYVGSAACKACHTAIYDRWTRTLMANVVRDPREHPDAVLPDFSKPDPLVNFTLDDVAYVYGSKWKQRYFKKVGDDYFPQPAQWDVTHKSWKPYFAKEDWWAAVYPPDNFQRPTGPLCDGCHSVNYNIDTKTVTEWNVGCERCHGPGSEHVKHPTSSNIVNAARLGYVAGNDVCIQCHSQGSPREEPHCGEVLRLARGVRGHGNVERRH